MNEYAGASRVRVDLWKIALLAFFSIFVTGCESDSSEKVLLSFGGSGAYADLNIHLPPNTQGRLASEGGLLSGGAVFDPPVHPLGEVRSLSIHGHDIEIENTTLQDGFLATKEFGAIEFLIPREGKIEMWGTQDQKDKMEKWLSKQ